MAFTGTAAIALPSSGLVRITGLSLAASAAGTISLSGGTGAVKTPTSVQWTPYAGEDDDNDQITLNESVYVSVKPVDTLTAALQVSQVKSGTIPSDFLVTLTNDDAVNATPALEIWLRFH